MGGLACALALAKQGFTHIDVYESASNLGFVGAGIQCAPNMARILDRLGCWADIEAEAVDVKETSVRQGATNDELAYVDLRYIRKEYSHPHMVAHRASLAGGMYEGCKKEKAINFFFGTACEKVDTWSPKPSFIAIRRKGGENYKVECDVLLAADGIKSVVRDQMLQLLGHHDAKVIDTKQAAYRIMVKREDMENDPDLKPLIDNDQVTRWIGEKRHIIAYPISRHQIYNMSSAQPDRNFANAPDATYTTKGSKQEMLETFHDFHPVVQKLLNKVPDGEVCEWKLRVHTPLPTWVHGSVGLVGDACHPTLPHLNQGAAQAIEDAAVIATVLDLIPSESLTPKGINKALKIYENVRKDRAYTLVDLAAQNGRALHLGEGAAKEERDRQFRELKEKGGSVPDKWADKDVQKNIYSWDAYVEAEKGFKEQWNTITPSEEVIAA